MTAGTLGIVPGQAGKPFILASASPRRRELLASLGVTFEVLVADVDESPLPDEDPHALALRLAVAKARKVAALRPEAIVLAADTVVAVHGAVLGKPVDARENALFLRRLSGREHRVFTGHALIDGNRVATEAPATTLVFRSLGEHEIARYSESGEGLDKAGGYALQGLGASLIESVHGDHTNVIGLSLPAVLRLCAQLGVAGDLAAGGSGGAMRAATDRAAEAIP